MERLKEDESEIIEKGSMVKSSVFGSNSNKTFCPLLWITISDFVNLDKSKNLSNSYPHGFSEDGESTFLGKTRSILKQSNRVTDQIGTVRRSSRKMEISHQKKVFEIQSFLVLGFKNLNNVQWKEVNLNLNKPMPKYALKVGIDVINQTIMYVGRTTSNGLTYVGHISGRSQLIAPLNGKVNCYNVFEVLCLKPTPASLRHLARIAIRHSTGNENLKMEQLEYAMEPHLVKYIKFNSCLKSNQSLSRGDCLISKDGNYKLSLELDGRLLYYFNDEHDYLFLYDNVESLWLSDLKLMVGFSDSTSKIFLTDSENLNIILDDAKFQLEDDGNFKLISPHHTLIVVLQLRDDLENYWNSSVPKFDFVYFLEQKKTKTDSDSDSESDSDSDSSSSTDSD